MIDNNEEEEKSFLEMSLENDDEDDLLTPEKIEELRKKNNEQVIKSTTLKKNPVVDTEVKLSEAIYQARRTDPANAGKGIIELESKGRFNLPDTVYPGSYKWKDLNDLALSKDEDLLPNLIEILDRNKKDSNYSFRDALIEELYEVLIGIKRQYYGEDHTFYYMCKCQNELPENKRVPSEYKFLLSSLKLRSIYEAEEALKKIFYDIYKSMTDEEFNLAMVNKYTQDYITTREDEVSKIKIVEPFKVRVVNGDLIEMRFSRVKDLIFGIQVANRMVAPAIKKVNNKYSGRYNEAQIDQINENKKKDLEEVEKEKVKLAIQYTKAQTLVSVNGVPFPNEEARVEYINNLDLADMQMVSGLLDTIAFGVHDEREMICNLCGTKERRWIHQHISPIEFIPNENNKGNGSTSTITRHTLGNIYI